ncbi:Alpha/Beta hydrolase protein [Microdochium trichocladiopsis]|uniref:Alpha/Beta hydrolase protein n=1 Tax=Microdochium trichocladiopsis TaxID=1682393 RepID=A0A9P8YKL1_9PEZI|nr:Alpha/Beta hydrolase protein [Microdochium trichocladiopsis]KAH7040734.1 Alpha/Beta hydrolase protein [Microdochium trichocladiopsis]
MPTRDNGPTAIVQWTPYNPLCPHLDCAHTCNPDPQASSQTHPLISQPHDSTCSPAMESLTKKTIAENSRGMTYTYYTSDPSTVNPSQPTLLLVHGFPDEAYMWDAVVAQLAPKGYRLIVPDMLGYAGTSKPTDPSAYRFKHIAADLVDILDAEAVGKVVSIGHDWGSAVAQRLYLWHPERVLALVMLNVAYMLPDPENPFDLAKVNKMMEQIFGYPIMAYQEFLASERGPKILREHADRVYLGSHLKGDNSMRDIFCVPGAIEKFLLSTDDDSSSDLSAVKPYAQNAEVRDRFVQRLQRDGFDGPVNYYRVFHADTQRLDEIQELTPDRFVVNVPAFYIACTKDAVCRPEMIGTPLDKGMLPDFDSLVLDCGHWCPLEMPTEVAEGIDGFVSKKLAGAATA